MDEVVIHKIGWCFTCDADDCIHLQNAKRSLIDALQHKEDKPTDSIGAALKESK
jgi:hypothetical protein